MLGQAGLFIVYFIIWIAWFGVLFDMNGANFVDQTDDYPDVNGYLKQFMQIFRNAVGDVQPPTYEEWTQNIPSTFMIAYVWILFSVFLIIMNVTLVNFLIAIVSETYEHVMDKAVQHTYNFKMIFVHENSSYMRVLDALGKLASWSFINLGMM